MAERAPDHLSTAQAEPSPDGAVSTRSAKRPAQWSRSGLDVCEAVAAPARQPPTPLLALVRWHSDHVFQL